MARPTISNRDFDRQVPKIIAPALGELGFEHAQRTCFLRPRNSWKDVLFSDLDQASKDCFYIVTGIHVPFVNQALRPLVEDDFPGALLWQHGPKRYFFGMNQSLEAALAEMLQDFRTGGLAWLEQFHSLEDVVAVYRRGSIDAPRGPSPVDWTTYGLLLQMLGRNDEASEWFERAKEELRKPIFTDGQRFYNERRPGTRRMAQPPSERKLLQWLESSTPV